MKRSDKTDKQNGRIMIAAASSGSGKTVITCGLLHILKDRGLDPVSFKCGPDYIDPMFHRTVLGVNSDNLDTFLWGADGVKDMVERASSYAVFEGVMGIYDGTSAASTEGSCYEIAQITETPIILVVNASGIGRTVISIIKGILADDTARLIKGIILNRMSDAFYEKLSPILASEIEKSRSDVAILGHIPKTDCANISSRHLGLQLPGEIADLRDRITSFSQIIAANCDIDALIRISNGGEGRKLFPCQWRAAECSRGNPVRGSALDEVSHESSVSYARTGARAGLRGNIFRREPLRKIAIARDEAFCFYYPENIRLLEETGAKIVYFSPIHNAKIPEDASMILLGGGYPELHLKELSENKSMLESIRSAIGSGVFSVAECGGFMYLHDVIRSPEGDEYKMVGAVNGKCTYTGHLVNFGYCRIDSVKESVACDFHEVLIGMRGHEFHYYESTAGGNDAILCKPSNGKTYEGMYITNDHIWGWPHFAYSFVPDN